MQPRNFALLVAGDEDFDGLVDELGELDPQAVASSAAAPSAAAIRMFALTVTSLHSGTVRLPGRSPATGYAPAGWL